MHFDQREQAALREAGLSTADLETASDRVAAAAERTAQELETFFADRETVYSDMDIAHSSADVQEHGVEYLDLYTHADEIRGYLRFDGWGVYVEDGRVLRDADEAGERANGGTDEEAVAEDAADPTLVELTLGPTVHDRVRFAPDPDSL